MFLGKMDAKTGKVTQYPIPETKQGFPVGTSNSKSSGNALFWGFPNRWKNDSPYG
jgi:hypothetical protein